MQGWMVSDGVLFQTLRAYLGSLDKSQNWAVDLFVNNHTAAPGDVFSDYVFPDSTQWPGYVGRLLPLALWGSVQVTADVASTINSQTAVFVFPSGVASLTIYGYLISDLYGNLIAAETFATPLVLTSPGGVQIQPRLNLGVEPVP